MGPIRAQRLARSGHSNHRKEIRMNAIQPPEPNNPDRRRFLGTAALTVAAAGAFSLLPAHVAAATEGNGVRTFRIDIPEKTS